MHGEENSITFELDLIFIFFTGISHDVDQLNRVNFLFEWVINEFKWE